MKPNLGKETRKERQERISVRGSKESGIIYYNIGGGEVKYQNNDNQKGVCGTHHAETDQKRKRAHSKTCYFLSKGERWTNIEKIDK